MKTHYDVIVIGAGPAGLSCSSELAERGLEVAVLDEQPSPGGQIYRNIKNSSSDQLTILGDDYREGKKLLQRFEAAAPHYFPRTRVWQAEKSGEVCLSRDGASKKIQGEYLVLATGAMERPVPFPGWTLPGVMTCGGMSNLYKDAGLFPKEPVVLAGSGPLLWLMADHLLHLDAPLKAILDTTPLKSVLPALRHLPDALRRIAFMAKGVKMIGAVHRLAHQKKVPILRNVTMYSARGDNRVELVEGRSGKREFSFEATTLLVSEGIIPNLSLFRQIGCDHTWNPVQRFHHPELMANGRTNMEKVYVAGDGGFVHGAKAAELKGKLTGIQIALELNRISRQEYGRCVEPLQKKLSKELLPRQFIDTLYAPRPDLFALSDDTTVCRCEGIKAGRIRDLVRQGYTDHNEIKAIERCGMGPCQGRMCSSAVHELITETSGIAPEKTRLHRLRPPIKPVSLQELANAELGETP